MVSLPSPTGLISELESRGARIVPIYSGDLVFRGPAQGYFQNTAGRTIVDTVINLTEFAFVGGPASQDHKKAASICSQEAEFSNHVCRAPRIPVVSRAPPINGSG